MRVLLQRVSSAKVYVDGKLKGSCAKGLLIFVCAMKGDDENVVNALTQKISKLRIFESSEGKMELTIHDIGGEALVVSQFTLAADLKKGTDLVFKVLQTHKTQNTSMNFSLRTSNE